MIRCGERFYSARSRHVHSHRDRDILRGALTASQTRTLSSDRSTDRAFWSSARRREDHLARDNVGTHGGKAAVDLELGHQVNI
jgi:hypothetical protein